MTREATFHLQGVVQGKDCREDFDGPLSAILMLLAKNKAEIRDICIAEILDQYLALLETMEEMDLEVSSEFTAMASQLVLMKTRSLLAESADQDELAELIRALEAMQNKDRLERLTQVLPQLEVRYGVCSNLLPREPAQQPAAVLPDGCMNAGDLKGALRRLAAEREENALPPVEQAALLPRGFVYPTDRKTGEILKFLRAKGSAELNGLLAGCRSLSERIAAFLAVLELCRTGAVALEGEADALVLTLSEKKQKESSHGQEGID